MTDKMLDAEVEQLGFYALVIVCLMLLVAMIVTSGCGKDVNLPEKPAETEEAHECVKDADWKLVCK